jgi:alkaline phosphatase
LTALSSAALAEPTNVAVTPPGNARFLPGQRFDLRVEGKGTGPFSATLSIDGVAQKFTSGAQNTSTTDGISAAGFGGFNLRGYESRRPGVHSVKASFTDSTGTVNVESKFEVVDTFGFREPIKNVIIFLGDGMGTAHRTAARLVRYGVSAGDPDGYLAMDSFPATGMITTHSLNSVITDSAPGMAGYVSGNHAQNGQEGVFPANMSNPFYAPRVEYLSEYLHRVQGKSLGIVTTADLEDATPAANAVHTGNRNNGTGIMDQFLDESDSTGTGRYGTGLRVLLGGGRRWLLPTGTFGSSRTEATDYPALPADVLSGWSLPSTSAGAADPARDLLTDFKNAGFSYADSATSLNTLLSGGTPDKLLGLFAYGNMNVALDKIAKRRNVLLPGASTFSVDDYHAPDQPMLDEMTSAALKVLNTSSKRHDDKGFVLMVEGAHIDKQSHAMDGERAVGDTLEFDRAIAVAQNFAAHVDRRTVVIVLADHECSGFSIIGGLKPKVADAALLPPDGTVLDPNTQPARQAAVNTYDAVGFPHYQIQPDGFPATFDIDGKLLFGFGANGDRYETWLTRPRPIIDSLLPADIKSELGTAGYAAQPYNRDQANGYFIRGQAVGKDQAVHTAADIPISAYSPRAAVAQQFVGVQRNVDVFFKLARAALGGY